MQLNQSLEIANFTNRTNPDNTANHGYPLAQVRSVKKSKFIPSPRKPNAINKYPGRLGLLSGLFFLFTGIE